MKFCNDFLVAKDWLRLMEGVEDRRIFLISYYAYHDGKSIQVVMTKDNRYFLDKAEGKNPKSPSLEVIAKVGSNTSMAKQISVGRKVEQNNADFWSNLANLIKNQ